MSGQHCENYDVKRETVHCYPRNVDRCGTSFVKKRDYLFSTGLTHLLCYITNHLMTGPLGNSEFCFPRISMFPSTSSRETLRFSGNKIHCSPRDQSLSVNCLILFSPAFRVKFPCTGKVTGGVLLTINISFVDVAGSEIWGPLSLTLKRQCVSGE